MPKNAGSVLHQMKLSDDLYPSSGNPRGHFRAANNSLLNSISGDPDYYDIVTRYIPDIGKQLINSRSISTKPPRGWTWHHSIEDGVMQLVPVKQHWDPNIWKVLHPDNKGGMSLWGGGYKKQ